MESIGVLMLTPMNSYLKQELWMLQIRFRARKSHRERKSYSYFKVSSCIAMAVAAAAAASLSTLSNHAYVDGPFYSYPFSSSLSLEGDQTLKSKSNKKAQAEDSSKSSGFNPESLEQGAKALHEINNSPYSKQVFQLMRKQEDVRLEELTPKKLPSSLFGS